MYAHRQLDQSVDESDPDGTDRGSAAEGRRRRTSIWAGILHESLDTLVLGTLSTSMGVVLILVSLRGAIGPGLPIELPLTTYFALIPIGTSLGVIGIVQRHACSTDSRRRYRPSEQSFASFPRLPDPGQRGHLPVDHGTVRARLLRFGPAQETSALARPRRRIDDDGDCRLH